MLLEGFVSGIDECHNRELIAFLRGVFVAGRDVRILRDRFLAVDYPGNARIPEGAEEFYLYAGEAGRRQNYAPQLQQKSGRYRRQIMEAFDSYVPVSPTKSGKSLPSERKEMGNSFVELLGQNQKIRRVPGIRLEIPYIQFGWESYHSSRNDFLGFNLPAPSLIQRLGLASKNREIDFYDSMGKPGTLYRQAGDGWKGDRHSLLYVRADLLRRYLTDTRQVLVWCNWGERDWFEKMKGYGIIDNPARQQIYQDNSTYIAPSFNGPPEIRRYASRLCDIRGQVCIRHKGTSAKNSRFNRLHCCLLSTCVWFGEVHFN